MKTVRIAEAKNNLSRYLKYVQRGGRVRILDRDVPVADLVPIEASADLGDDAWLADLAQQGVVHPGDGGPLPAELFRPGPRGRDRGRGVLRALLDERAAGR
jgi:prevent-host-death family protein